MSPRLSIAMIVKNEASRLARCLQSVRGVADEIVLVDTGSTDNTLKIARDFGANILHFTWIDDFSAARNFGLERATGDWIFILDADEWLSQTLVAEIPAFMRGKPAVGRVKQVSDFQRKNQALRSQCIVPRLFPRGGAHYEGRVHEQLISNLPRETVVGELWHDGYLEVANRTARNVKLLTRELERDPDNVYYLYQIAIEHNSVGDAEKAFPRLQKAFSLAKPNHTLAPNIAVDFLYTIIELKQFEAGIEVIAKAEPHLGDFPDFFLVRGLLFMHLVRSNPPKYISELPKIEQSFQRCLELGEDQRRKSVLGSGTFLASYNLGVFYHVFGNVADARRCLEAAAAQGYEPAAALLKKL